MIWQPGKTLEDAEKDIILEALRFYGNNKSMTSRSLGICVRTLDNKLEQYGRKEIEPEKRQTIGPDTSSGLHVESVAYDAEKQSLSMQKRQKVQEVPPQQPAESRPNKKGA